MNVYFYEEGNLPFPPLPMVDGFTGPENPSLEYDPWLEWEGGFEALARDEEGLCDSLADDPEADHAEL